MLVEPRLHAGARPALFVRLRCLRFFVVNSVTFATSRTYAHYLSLHLSFCLNTSKYVRVEALIKRKGLSARVIQISSCASSA